MRPLSRGGRRLVACLPRRHRAAGDWGAWTKLPRRLAARLAEIDCRAGSVTVAYPRHPEPRPAARQAPCRLIAPAHLAAAMLNRVRALERGHGQRLILVAYRCSVLR
jgi:hypothetical protein